MIKKLFLLATFLTTALFSGLNDSIYAQAPNAVELETLNQEQIKNIIQVNSEEELPKDNTTYTLVYSKQHCTLPDEPEKTTKSTPDSSITHTTAMKAQVKQSLPQTGTHKSVAVVLTAGILVVLAFLMIKYHKKKVWMVLFLTTSVTSLYNLRNVMAETETKVTPALVTTFIPTKEHCLVGYIIIPNSSETTKFETSKGNPLVFDNPEFNGGVPGMPEVNEKPEFNGGVVPNEAPIHDKPSIETTMEEPIFESSSVETTTTAVTATEATVTSATTTTSTEPTTTTEVTSTNSN